MTTTTELALIEPETAEVQPFTAREAKAFDKKIRSASDKVVTAHSKVVDLIDELTNLLTEARDREIHKALGLKSWTAYVSDAVRVPELPEREDRKALATFLSGQGMSQRAIAGTLGVSQKTIDRDLEDEPVENGATVESLDGKKRPKTAKQEPAAEPAQEPLEAEVVDEEQNSAPTPAVELVDLFNDETANLWNACAELKEFLREEKWSGARKRVAKANLNHITQVITDLQAIADDLMTG